jgi:hypothetical protein
MATCEIHRAFLGIQHVGFNLLHWRNRGFQNNLNTESIETLHAKARAMKSKHST